MDGKSPIKKTKQKIFFMLTLLNWISWGTIFNTVDDGIANPTPADVPVDIKSEYQNRFLHDSVSQWKSPVCVNMAVLIPIKFPFELSRGPPLRNLIKKMILQEKCNPLFYDSLDVPISRVNGCIGLNSTTNGNSGLTKYVTVKTADDPNRKSVVKTKRVSNC